ncbi:MAG: hypothetical protein JXQ83_09435 [Candidatus Glassbacteria bacterium]|nr:hypothetical protein [Candidatus Glassbacteria bacterium]
MKPKLLSPFLLLACLQLAAPQLKAEKHLAGGEILFSGNRLISTISETGQRFYRPVKQSTKAFPPAVLDGKAGESFWEKAQQVGPFLEESSGEKRDCSVLVAYDRDNIYLFWKIGTRTAPAAAVTLPDTALGGDSYLQVDLYPCLPDSFRYGRGYYYSLAVNPLGTLWDAYYDPYQEGYFFTSWNSGARVETTRRSDGWTAEIVIPFSGLDLYSDAGWSWNLEFHQSEGEPASAPCGVRVAQGVDVRRPAWVAYYWDRPELMPGLQPNAATMFDRQRSVRSARAEQAPALNGSPDPGPFASAGEVALLLRDDTAEPVEETGAGSFKVAGDREKLYFQFRASSGRAVTAAGSGGQGASDAGMAAQMEGVNGVFKDLELLSREGFWVLLQPRVPGLDAVHQGYYLITLDNTGSVKGTRYDEEGIPDHGWDPGATADLFNMRQGWGAELTVPVSSMEIPPGCGTSWGLNVFQNAIGANGNSELAAWCPSRGHHHDTRHIGRLDGLDLAFELQVRKSLALRLVRLQDSARKLGKAFRDQAGQIIGDAEKLRRKTPVGEPAELSRLSEELRQRLGRLQALEYYGTQPRPPAAGHHLLDICMAGGTNLGWAVGRQGVVLHTSDGGRTWSAQESGTTADLQRVQFIDSDLGWVVGGRVRMGETNETMRHDQRGGFGYILHTADGGKTWEIQYAEQGRYLFGLHMLDSLRGWACGERGTILQTTDGGAHWHDTANSGTIRWLYGTAFLDSLRGFIVGEAQTVLATGDGGRTWREVDAPADRDFYGFLPHYRSVAFQGESGWIAGQNGTILGTVDGGRTWRAQSEVFSGPVRELLDLERIHFIDSRRGWAVGRLGSRVMATGDGGASWRLMPVPNRASLSGVWLDASGRALLAGAQQRILLSGDGGLTWQGVHGAEAKLDALSLMAHGDDGPIMFGPMYSYYTLVEGRRMGDIQTMRDAHSVEYQGEIYNLEHHRSVNLMGLVVADYLDEDENGNNGCDYYHYTQRLWGDERPAIRRLVALIRTFRPEVVLTQEPVFGEYDKPGHKLAGRATLEAFNTAGGQEDHWPELTRLGLPPWQPKKLYCIAGVSYPETLDLTGLLEKPVGRGNLSAFDWGEWAIRCFQSQGVYHVEASHLSLIQSLVPVPEREQSIFDGIE